jgi:Co/Zn/Cd efflux system component
MLMMFSDVHVQEPKWILIVGSAGLALNILVLSFLHGERTPLYSLFVTMSLTCYIRT